MSRSLYFIFLNTDRLKSKSNSALVQIWRRKIIYMYKPTENSFPYAPEVPKPNERKTA